MPISRSMRSPLSTAIGGKQSRRQEPEQGKCLGIPRRHHVWSHMLLSDRCQWCRSSEQYSSILNHVRSFGLSDFDASLCSFLSSVVVNPQHALLVNIAWKNNASYAWIEVCFLWDLPFCSFCARSQLEAQSPSNSEWLATDVSPKSHNAALSLHLKERRARTL